MSCRQGGGEVVDAVIDETGGFRRGRAEKDSRIPVRRHGIDKGRTPVMDRCGQVPQRAKKQGKEEQAVCLGHHERRRLRVQADAVGLDVRWSVVHVMADLPQHGIPAAVAERDELAARHGSSVGGPCRVVIAPN